MAEWNRRIACQCNSVALRLIFGICLYTDDPAEHPLLQSRDGLMLDAKRLRPLDVELGRVGAGVIEHLLCRDDVAAGGLVIFGGDAASQQDGGKIRQKRPGALRCCLIPDGDPGIGAFDEHFQSMRQSPFRNGRDPVLLLALLQEQPVSILVAGPRCERPVPLARQTPA
jgi:hypothetical protein